LTLQQGTEQKMDKQNGIIGGSGLYKMDALKDTQKQ